MFVLSAGALMNFVLAIFLFCVSFMIPREVSVGRAVINQVLPGSPAAAAGLQTGDVIYKINGRDINNVTDASYNIRLNLGETITMTVKRGQRFPRPQREGALGASRRAGADRHRIGSQYPFTETQSYAPWTAFRLGTRADLRRPEARAQRGDLLVQGRQPVLKWRPRRDRPGDGRGGQGGGLEVAAGPRPPS